MATNEQEYLPNERDLVGYVGVESGARTTIGRRLDVGYEVKSVSDQQSTKWGSLLKHTSWIDGSLSESCCPWEVCEGRGESESCRWRVLDSRGGDRMYGIA